MESIGNIVLKASGTGMGAFTGFVLAGDTPLLFILVPAGMILFGAAAGVARALEEGLRERVLKLIRSEGQSKESVNKYSQPQSKDNL